MRRCSKANQRGIGERNVVEGRTMDLNRLTVFSKVVEEGSVTKAARALALPKSSVSRNITLLEEELGMRLLHRSSRKVTVTEVGAAYHADVARALASIDD